MGCLRIGRDGYYPDFCAAVSTEPHEISNHHNGWTCAALVAGRKTDFLCFSEWSATPTSIGGCSYYAELWFRESFKVANRQNHSPQQHGPSLRHHTRRQTIRRGSRGNGCIGTARPN